MTTTLNEIPFDFFVSPVTKSPLQQVDELTAVDSGGKLFRRNRDYGFWDFVPAESPLYTHDQWKSFAKLIENFEISYRNDPSANVSYDERPEALAFGDFCRFGGDVLDVGCGPHRAPSYIRYRRPSSANFFGLDVLVGEHPKELSFVRGMGEHIPFRDDLFDVTVSGTSLLHYVDVKAGIAELARVTKPAGRICIWLGVKDRSAPPPAASPNWYKSLEVPAGAENPFHYRRYASDEFVRIFDDLGLTLTDMVDNPVDDWRRNVFFEVSKSRP